MTTTWSRRARVRATTVAKPAPAKAGVIKTADWVLDLGKHVLIFYQARVIFAVAIIKETAISRCAFSQEPVSE